jgi:hypothetical protein
VSHKLGRSDGRIQTPASAHRALDRPSLFAGVSQGDEADEDMQRVRLLSTLESARKPQRRAPSKSSQRPNGDRIGWQVKALIGLMGAGVLALLLSFVMVVREGHPPGPALTNAAAPNLQASAVAVHSEGVQSKRGSGPLGALQSTPSPETPSTPVALSTPAGSGDDIDAHTPTRRPATIESIVATTPPAATNAVVLTSPSPDRQARPAATLPTEPPVAHGAPPKALAAVTPALRPGSATTAATTPTDTRVVAARRKASSKDEDVALVEAMFEHASPRRQTALAAAATTNPGVDAKASPDSSAAVADELQRRCASLAGAEGATCRARVCVQHPKAAACHAD